MLNGFDETLKTHWQTSNISCPKSENLNVSYVVLQWSLPNWLNQVLSREWGCSWSSGKRQCSNYIWVINNFIAYYVVSYIWGFTVFALSIINKHWDGTILHMEQKESFNISYISYQGCWWPGDTSHQGSSSHGTDLVVGGYSRLSPRRANINNHSNETMETSCKFNHSIRPSPLPAQLWTISQPFCTNLMAGRQIILLQIGYKTVQFSQPREPKIHSN